MKNLRANHVLRAGLVTAASLIVATGAGHAAAVETCPARPQTAPAAKATTKTPNLAKMSPSARRLHAADRAYDAGQFDEAETLLLKLMKTPRDKNDTARRATIRLARVRIQQGRFDDARALATQASASRDAKVKAQATAMLTDIDYRQGIAAARNRFDQAEALLKSGNLTESETQFEALLSQPCPLPEGYIDRVQLRLASISTKQNDFDEAERRLAAVDRSDANIASAAGELDGSVVQKRLDFTARTALDAAASKAESGDVAGAVEAEKLALATYPTASAPVLSGGQLRLSDHLSRLGRFDEARTVLSAVHINAGDADLATRRDEIAKRIDVREMDAKASDLLAQADDESAVNHPQKAMVIYDGIIASPQFAPEWHQRAKLRKATLLRRGYDFAGAKAQIDAVAAAPATPSLAASAVTASDTFAAETPARAFTGSLGGGLQYDDNAPALVAAIPGEEGTAPYDPQQSYSDAATVVTAGGEYRHRLGSSYNYLTAAGRATVTDQWELDPIDRVKIDFNLGAVIYLPSLAAKVEGGLLYDRSHRGGKLLNQGLGFYTSYSQLAMGRRVTGRYEGLKMDDRRPGRDGWRHSVSLEVAPATGEYGLAGGIELFHDQPSDITLRQSAVTVSAGYVWPMLTRGSWQVDGDVAVSLRTGRYDAISTSASGADEHRKIVRTRFEVGPVATYKQTTQVRVTYAWLDIDDNKVNFNRRDNQVRVSVSRRF
ncbi:tetratricopeptide repeat family protein [Asticcacaulis biprosthecium C19]|uniref:Tetratricopeptide repeat family protein n=1 Tax=Asticcacaulis biprosthecium C19 TaxID=715226 RepID=F4QTL2_9CAUL|nr:hypothetical protein [Asticcacaulis biprosthecium]EGF90082.1 tetratricopeptide repeat family protein [Asticcacaulis biprosthecium C19]